MTRVFSVQLESQTESYNFLVHNKKGFLSFVAMIHVHVLGLPLPTMTYFTHLPGWGKGRRHSWPCFQVLVHKHKSRELA